MKHEDLKTYAGHRVELQYEKAALSGFAYTNWVLFVDGHLFYLGQDSKFVIRVLGRDFAEFIHEAFQRAGIETPDLGGELDAEQRELLRISLCAGIVRALDDLFSERDEDFFAAVAGGLEPWSLSAD